MQLDALLFDLQGRVRQWLNAKLTNCLLILRPRVPMHGHNTATGSQPFASAARVPARIRARII